MREKKLKDTDFLCISAIIHSRLCGSEILNRIAEADGFDEAFELVCGLCGIQGDNDGDSRKVLSDRLSECYAFADGLIKDTFGFEAWKYRNLLAPFKYVYDCRNLKTAVKCRALHKNPVPMMSQNGTVSAEKTVDAVNSGDFSLFPKNLAQKVQTAQKMTLQTGDPQTADMILDYAVFEDMTESAEKSGLEYLTELIACRADTANIMTAARCAGQGYSAGYMQKFLVPGGKLDFGFFVSNYGISSEKLAAALMYTEYSDVVTAFGTDGVRTAEAERICSEIYLKKADSAEKIPFGAELIVYYIVKKEIEIRNLRIILDGKACGIGNAEIKERLMTGI